MEKPNHPINPHYPGNPGNPDPKRKRHMKRFKMVISLGVYCK